MEMNEDVKERRRTMIIMKNDRPNMFAYIYSKLSIESELEALKSSRNSNKNSMKKSWIIVLVST